jgi:hypothetical protein
MKGTITDTSNEYGSNVRPEFLTQLQIESYQRAVTTLAQIRLAWKEYEALWDKSSTTMGEIQAELAEVSRLVHSDD